MESYYFLYAGTVYCLFYIKNNAEKHLLLLSVSQWLVCTYTC